MIVFVHVCVCVEVLAMIQSWKAFNQLKELNLIQENVSEQMLKKLACQSASSWGAEGQHATPIRQQVPGLTNAKVGAAKAHGLITRER